MRKDFDEVSPSLQDVARALQSFVEAVRTHYGARLHSIVLFGSRARGDMQPDSDADVAVILSATDFHFWCEKVVLADLTYEPFMESGLRIQPWPVSETAWEDPDTHHNTQLVKNMKRDGRPLLELL